jgi:hypothetical protein
VVQVFPGLSNFPRDVTIDIFDPRGDFALFSYVFRGAHQHIRTAVPAGLLSLKPTTSVEKLNLKAEFDLIEDIWIRHQPRSLFSGPEVSRRPGRACRVVTIL